MKKKALFFTDKNNKNCQEIQRLVENKIKAGDNFKIIDVNGKNKNIKTLQIRKEAVPQFAMFQDGRHIFSTTAVQTEKELTDFYNYDVFLQSFIDRVTNE
jgi:hypothetical protein